MSTPLKVTAFVAALGVVFALAVGLGAVLGPDAEPRAAHEPHGTGPAVDGQASAGRADLPGGLAISQDGYTLALSRTVVRAGHDVPVSFTVTGPDGRAVTEYDVEHEKRLHLIAVRRDLTGFQHVHPRMAPDGTWSAGLDLTAGQWRLFADFRPAGADALTLGADLAVPGASTPAERTQETRTAHVDGYTVTIDGDLVAGTDTRLSLRVERGGEPVTDLEPYLGAYGHLVALRSGDLAYLHVHPDGAPHDGATRPGPDVVFHTTVPSAGRYHLYLDFQHRGVVRTAAFTLDTAGTAAAPADAPGDDHTRH